MKFKINTLNKWELIKVVACMHDSIQDWNQHGYNPPESEILNTIGASAVDCCTDLGHGGFDLTTIKLPDK